MPGRGPTVSKQLLIRVAGAAVLLFSLLMLITRSPKATTVAIGQLAQSRPRGSALSATADDSVEKLRDLLLAVTDRRKNPFGFDVVRVETNGVSFVMALTTISDVVSSTIRRSGVWDRYMVDHLDFLMRDRCEQDETKPLFLDIGANVGQVCKQR